MPCFPMDWLYRKCQFHMWTWNSLQLNGPPWPSRCAVLINIYRLEDELWHVNKINSFGHGSHRDYRPKWPSASHIGHFTPETKPKHSRKLDNSQDSRSCQPSPMLWFRRNMGVVLVIENPALELCHCHLPGRWWRKSWSWAIHDIQPCGTLFRQCWTESRCLDCFWVG